MPENIESRVRRPQATKLMQFVGLLPLLGPLAIIFYFAKAWNYLGYFPRPGVPDPKDLPFAQTYTTINAVANASFFLEIIVLAILATLTIRSIFFSKVNMKLLTVLVVGRMVFWSFCFAAIFSWFAD